MQDDETNLEFPVMESNDPSHDPLREPSAIEPVPPEAPFINPHADEEDPSKETSLKTEAEPRKKKGGKRGDHKEKPSGELQQFLDELELQKDVEAKLEFSLGFMKACISQDSPNFKGFWEARIKSLAFFKENISPSNRAQKWAEFSELSKEARRMKDQLDEQSDFASEQIDIAIGAIEKELEELSETLKEQSPHVLPFDAYALDANADFYQAAQTELHHLNLLATRITSLRKELIKTEMRIRTKNKFFDRLSKAGDLIFPRRKTLIHDLSQMFMADIEKFIHYHFSEQGSQESIFKLREEIKALQHAAKLLTLNTLAFSQTRLSLSECWDKLKEQDKERKVEFDKRKDEFKKNESEFKEMIEAAAAKFESGEHSPSQTISALDEISTLMRNKDLGRDEVKTLRSLLGELKDKIHAKQKEQENKRLESEELRLQQRRELVQEFRGKIEEFLNGAKELSSEAILQQKEEIASEIQKSTLSKPEKIELEKLLKNLKEILREKKEIALRSLPADDRQALEQLKELLKQKQEEKQEIEEIREYYRKQSGLSGISFEKGLEYSALIAEQREKLDRAQEAVREVEMKIDELESKLSE
jgi:hypothetical protein